MPCLLLILALALAPAARSQANADQEIQYLLNYVAASACTFVRNGSAHDPADAADHLRLKYDRGRRHAGSAEQFIDRLASQSSWSGKPYTVDCAGSVEPTGAWLHRALSMHRHQTMADSGISQ